MFLLVFIASRTLLMLHAFFHHDDGKQNVEVKNFAAANFLEKIIFTHEKSTDKKSQHCLICAASNFQNHISLAPNLLLSALCFYLIFALRKFDRVKLSYLLSSKSPRAPPLIS